MKQTILRTLKGTALIAVAAAGIGILASQKPAKADGRWGITLQLGNTAPCYNAPAYNGGYAYVAPTWRGGDFRDRGHFDQANRADHFRAGRDRR